MSDRRMFSNRIANSAKFLQMPSESQLLYFHFVLRADDDGVVESYPIIKLLGVAPDNFKVLLAKGFIRLLNEDQVIVIPDWSEHNTLRADRKTDSIYKQLVMDKYPDIPLLTAKPRKDNVNSFALLEGGQSVVGVSKVKLSKDKLNKINKESILETFKDYPEIDEKVIDFTYQKVLDYEESSGKKYKDYNATIRNWLRTAIEKGRFKKKLTFEEEILLENPDLKGIAKF